MAQTIKNPVSEVYETWGEAIESIVGEGNYSMDDSASVASAPYARMLMLSAVGVNYDLEGDELSIRPTFQIESYADGRRAISNAYAIDDVSHRCMTSMGYRRTYGPELITSNGAAIKRVVSRYNRIYAG